MRKKENKAKFFNTNLCFFLLVDTLVTIKSCDHNSYRKHLANRLSNDHITVDYPYSGHPHIRDTYCLRLLF